ncbi:hypothetical protein [Sporomusa sp.]|uniref:AbiTii domain-containing protein n=1 Tax=Sporomusa sp. TaxID=2078658 RepID=UPI002BD118DE|nr:hypothetical protein [Sporomusa sp.]HWR43928.1 hypothetical protein [Sporomusa sp.]
MSSVVLDFQNEIISSTSRLTDLLLKGLLIAKKLGLSEFESWLVYELEGYKSVESLPEYRKIHGGLYYYNPHIGKHRLAINDKELETVITTHQWFCQRKS